MVENDDDNVSGNDGGVDDIGEKNDDDYGKIRYW